MRISGASDDREAKVGEYGLETFSTSKSMQHTISHGKQDAFQVSGLIDKREAISLLGIVRHKSYSESSSSDSTSGVIYFRYCSFVTT